MHSTEDFLFNQRKLLPSGKLPFAGEAGKARQVVDVSFRPPDPVGRVDVPPAAGAAGAVPPATTKDVQGEGAGPAAGGKGRTPAGSEATGMRQRSPDPQQAGCLRGRRGQHSCGFFERKKKNKNQQVCIW